MNRIIIDDEIITGEGQAAWDGPMPATIIADDVVWTARGAHMQGSARPYPGRCLLEWRKRFRCRWRRLAGLLSDFVFR